MDGVLGSLKVCVAAFLRTQMPLCYSPAIEYRLPNDYEQPPSQPNSVLFPGISKDRREDILTELKSAGIKTRVKLPVSRFCAESSAHHIPSWTVLVPMSGAFLP